MPRPQCHPERGHSPKSNAERDTQCRDLRWRGRFLVRLGIPSEILLGFASHCFAVRLALLAQDDADGDDTDGDDTDGLGMGPR